MSRLDYSFETNMESKNKELQTPYLESLIFALEDGNILYVGCQGWHDYSLESHVSDGVMRDLEFSLWDSSFREISDWELADENDSRFIELLSSAVEMVGFIAGDDELFEEHGYDDDFVPTANDVVADLTIHEKEFHFEADELLYEAELIAKMTQGISR